MHVDVVTVRVQATIENEWSVHERAGINKTSVLAHAHLFYVEDIAPIENLEEDGGFTSEDHDFLVGDLVRQTHVRWHPACFVNSHSTSNLLPYVSLDVVHFNSVHDAFLVNTPSESKHVVVLKGA